jgi:hypothetical protein
MNGLTKRGRAALIFVIAGLLIAGVFADWWFGIEKPRHEAAKKAAEVQDPNARYWSQLRLVRHIKQPFRLLFEGYDGDPNKPSTMDFEISPIDVAGGGTQFLHIGDVIAGTKFKIMKFGYNSSPIPGGRIGSPNVTLENTETRESVVLTLNMIANDPDTYAVLLYLRNNSEFVVKKNAEFVLPPDVTLRYRLIDVTETEAVILTPTGQEVSVPHGGP